MNKLTKICPNCKKENKDTAKFCESCGVSLNNSTVTSEPKESKGTSGGLMGWWNQQSTRGKAAIGLVGLCCLGLIVVVGISGMMAPDKTTTQSSATQPTTQQSTTGQSAQTSQSSSNDQGPITVQNLKVSNAGYGEYKVTCSIIPTQDESYLEMATIWYDSTGAVIYQDTLAWNINNAKAGQTYKVTASTYLSDEGTPAKVNLLIFDSVFSGGDTSNAIFNQNLTV